MVSIWVFIAKYRNRLAALLIALLTLLAYSNTLENSFVFDDYLVIADNNFIKSWHNLPRIFSKNYLTSSEDTYLLGKQDVGSGESTYRPVVTTTYFIDYCLWGLKPFGYHLTNLLLHIVNALLLFYFVSLITKNHMIALLAGLLFALHPVNTEAVYVISFRKDLLAFLFFISSLIIYIRLDDYRGKKKPIAYCLSIILFCLALFSKEMAVTLPAVLMLYDYFFNKKRGLQEILANLKFRYSGYILIGLCYLFISQFLIGSKYPHLEYPGGSFYTNILTMSVAIAEYIKWIFIPLNLHFILPDPSAVYYSLNTTVILSILLVVLFLFVAFKSRKTAKESSFSILWFYITLVPVSNIFALVSPAALRYLYIPIAGLCLLEAWLLTKIFTLSLPWLGRKVLGAFGFFVISVILISYSMITMNIGSIWKDNISMWSDMVKWYPKNITALSSLGKAYEKIGADKKAIGLFKNALYSNPNNAWTHNALGSCYGNIGQHNAAIAEYTKAVSLNPDYADAYNNLCDEYISVGKNSQAIESCKKATELNPRMAVAYYNIANAYANSGKKEDALKANQKAIGINPNYMEACNNLAVIYADMGHIDKAIDLWSRVVTINPSFAMAHFNLSVYYFRQGKFDLAIQHCDKVIALGNKVDPELIKMLKPYRK
jgi:Tfp pilus assembly protein PilF